MSSAAGGAVGERAIGAGVTALVLHPDDDVACLLADAETGSAVRTDDGRSLMLGDAVPLGHKVALRDLDSGEPVRKFGAVIGRATCPIPVGAHVHLHNLTGLARAGEGPRDD